MRVEKGDMALLVHVAWSKCSALTKASSSRLE